MPTTKHRAQYYELSISSSIFSFFLLKYVCIQLIIQATNAVKNIPRATLKFSKLQLIKESQAYCNIDNIAQ